MIRDSNCGNYVILDEEGNIITLSREYYSLQFVNPSRNLTILCSFKRDGVNEGETYIALALYTD